MTKEELDNLAKSLYNSLYNKAANCRVLGMDNLADCLLEEADCTKHFLDSFPDGMEHMQIIALIDMLYAVVATEQVICSSEVK